MKPKVDSGCDVLAEKGLLGLERSFCELNHAITCDCFDLYCVNTGLAQVVESTRVTMLSTRMTAFPRLDSILTSLSCLICNHSAKARSFKCIFSFYLLFTLSGGQEIGQWNKYEPDNSNISQA